MAKKPGRGPKRHRGAPRGGKDGGAGGGGGGGRGRPGRGKRGPGGRPPRPSFARKSDYFMQPGRNGVFLVFRRPIGNRADPKLCGTMPSGMHAKMLVQQLERAESVVKDLFMEATDDGIEALEAVLAACCEEVLKRGPVAPPESRGRQAPASEPETEIGEIEEVEPADEDGDGGDEDPYAAPGAP